MGAQTTAGRSLLAGRYSLQERIGSGGMASVWLAEDTRLGRPVAVKRLAEGLADDPAFRARFRREATVAASLTHPNLVGVFDFDAEAQPPFTVMEYVPGPNLAERLEQGEQVDSRRLARDLLSALGAIHGAGVVHRDVKPQNLLISAGGRAKLADFGVAKPADATSITQTGQILGTAHYMPPELLEGDPATPRSDLFAAGVVIAECMEAGGARDRALGELVERLTEPEPSRRPESASAALLMLGQPGARTDPATLVAGPEHTRRVDLRAALPALGAIAAVLVAIVVIVLVSVGGDGNSPERAAEPPAAENQPAEAQHEGGGEAAEPGGGGQGNGGGAESEASGPPDPALGEQLNQQGFDLMNAGDYEAAIPVLRRAVDAFGSQTRDLNYAYALYNLGRSLRLAGRPDQAVPLLRERLGIPNQTGVVRRELQAALAARDG
jgi:Protein kinase domain/Tetratricopeptide repeat